MKNLRKKIERDFGKECKDYKSFCACCIAHRALRDLENLYDVKKSQHYKNQTKVGKNLR